MTFTDRFEEWGRSNPGSIIEAAEALTRAQCRRSFYKYRQLVRPDFDLSGWWYQETAKELQRFYTDLVAGKNPKLLLQAPPQHGKSTLVQDFICYVRGMDPSIRKVFTSYSADLGTRTNLQVRRTCASEEHKIVFPDDAHGRMISKFIEYGDGGNAGGFFFNTTMLGAVTGFPSDLGLIDDPIKGWEEAYSERIRERVIDGYKANFATRKSARFGLLGIMTRWHVDDLFGWLIKNVAGIRVLTYPAIATKDEYSDDGRLLRKEGDPLVEGLHSLDFLKAQRAELGPLVFEALYQQSPYIPGGGLFPRTAWQYMDFPPPKDQIVSSCLFWDNAGTKDAGAYTAGVLLHKLTDNRYAIETIHRGQWGIGERDKQIKATGIMFGEKYRGLKIKFEQEPGSAGIHQAEAQQRMLAGYITDAERATGAKETRAMPLASMVHAHSVYLVKGEWNAAFVQEAELFPASKYKDQVDAASGAFTEVMGPRYRMEMLT